jgi:hypothetical protein
MLIDLAQDQSAEGRARLQYFLINKGPWDRLDHNKPFVPGTPAKPEGANFYPDGAAKADIDRWMKSLPDAERAKAVGFFTVIRRSGTSFAAVPYSDVYREELTHAAALLREAASLAAEPTLKNFLTKRAAAFLSNDYYESDVAWMELKGAIEPTIVRGVKTSAEPKAAFEAYVRPGRCGAKLQRFAGSCRTSNNPHRHNPARRLAPIVVVNEVFAAGDARAACNLPNDNASFRKSQARHAEERAGRKFAKTLVPISKVALTPADQKDVAFDAFFMQIVVTVDARPRPSNITVNGKTTVRQEIKEAHSYLEEAGRTSRRCSRFSMIDKGVLPKSLEAYTTHSLRRRSIDSVSTKPTAAASPCSSTIS